MPCIPSSGVEAHFLISRTETSPSGLVFQPPYFKNSFKEKLTVLGMLVQSPIHAQLEKGRGKR